MSAYIWLTSFADESLLSSTPQIKFIGRAAVKIITRLVAVFLTFVIGSAVSISDAQEIGPGPTHLLTFSARPTIYIGYLYPNKATTFSVDMGGTNIFDIQSFKQSLNIQGAWTELLVPIKTSSPLGLLLGFGYLFPYNNCSHETYSTIAGIAERTWGTSTQMFNIQTAATYRMLPSITTIIGFRYDSFMTNYKDPAVDVFQNLYLRGIDIAEFDFSGYIPFLGVMVEKTLGGYGSSLKASIIGLPALFGSFVYKERVNSSSYLPDRWNGMKASNEFSSGYFLEAEGELSVPISWCAQVGAFVKYSCVYGKATTVVNTAISVLPINDSYSVKNYPHDAGVTFERSSWILGGTISANF